MSHLLCPLCGKYSALSTLISNELEPDLKVVSFKGLGRKKGFVRSEVYSILGDDEYTPIIVDRIYKLYNLLVDRGLIIRTIDNSTLNLLNAENELKNQLASKDSRIYSLANENRDKDSEIEELELRSHVDYIILETLSLDLSAKLRFDQDSYYMVLTPKTNALNLFLLLLMKEIPARLRSQLLSHVDSDDFPNMGMMLKNIPEKKSVMDELLGDSHWRFKGINYSGQDPYTLKFSELKKIVSRIKDTIFNPEELNKLILRNLHLDKIEDHESHTDIMIRIIKELEDKRLKK